MTQQTRVDFTGPLVVASCAGLLVGWLISGGIYAGQLVPEFVSFLIWAAWSGGLGYWLYRRMTSPYRDFFEDRLVHTRTGQWLVMVTVLLMVLVVVRLLGGLSGDEDLGPMLWGFEPL